MHKILGYYRIQKQFLKFFLKKGEKVDYLKKKTLFKMYIKAFKIIIVFNLRFI